LSKLVEPEKTQIGAGTDLNELLRSRCGSARPEVIALLRERNPTMGYPVSRENMEIELPPCPFWQPKPTIMIPEDGNLNQQLLLHMGTAGRKTLASVKQLNEELRKTPDRVSPGQAVQLPYAIRTESFRLRGEFRGAPEEVVAQLRNVAGVLPSPGIGPGLHLVRQIQELAPSDSSDFCEPPSSNQPWPFDPAELLQVLSRNRELSHRKLKLAVVLVPDTGVDEDEQRLFFAYDTPEHGGIPNFDDDQNGYIDDEVGTPMSTKLGFPASDEGYSRADHGTHVAGLVLGGLGSPELTAAVKDRIALKLINLVESRTEPGPGNGAPKTSWEIPPGGLSDSLTYWYGSDRVAPLLINLSVETDSELPAFARILEQTNSVIVAAAGNSGKNIDRYPTFPAYYSRSHGRHFLTVAAHDATGALTDFSNFGKYSVDLAAPGCRVRSSVRHGEWSEVSGTSQAAPLVSFTAALLLSEGIPLLSIKQRILDAVDLDTRLMNCVASGGRLNIAKALSIYEDLVQLDGELIRGLIQEKEFDLCGEEFSIQDLHRIVPQFSQGTDQPMRVWVEHAQGFVDPIDCAFSDQLLSIKVRDGVRKILLKDARDVIFARFR
jgi:subtilisin family serine protease